MRERVTTERQRRKERKKKRQRKLAPPARRERGDGIVICRFYCWGPRKRGSGSRKTGINKTNTHCIFSCPCPTTPLTRLHTPSNCHIPPHPLPRASSSTSSSLPHLLPLPTTPERWGRGVLGRTFTPHASGCQGDVSLCLHGRVSSPLAVLPSALVTELARCQHSHVKRAPGSGK